jgi:hypothetical protein
MKKFLTVLGLILKLLGKIFMTGMFTWCAIEEVRELTDWLTTEDFNLSDD